MLGNVFLLLLVGLAVGQRLEYYDGPPQPYTFSYDITNDFGTRLSQTESGDANNVKTGTYSYSEATGIYRNVNYIADQDGFRVTIDTNEPGTKTSAPAGVVINSQAADVAPPATPLTSRPAAFVAAPAPRPRVVAQPFPPPARFVAPIPVARSPTFRLTRPAPLRAFPAPAVTSSAFKPGGSRSFTLGGNPPLTYTFGRSP
ncbi:uncharacterized protein LOC119185889 [Rhipicephalus microplus]|uniref:uncharacterized protein LOC119185889 n=1 Tax=Rhipicephalus microplus TaxID=6941 RepID=UPI003F6C3E2F